MTSPVDTSVKHFFSSMSGAPVLQKQPGSLIALLDAVLVLGFDAKPVTSIAIAAGIATVSFNGDHSSTPHSVVLIAGADPAFAALNGEQKVLTRSAGKLTFATALAAGNATGTMTVKMAPAGWAKPFSADNVAVYRSSDPASNGFYLRVDDTGNFPGPGMARVRGYATMSDVNTGTGMFPLPEQIAEDTANGGFWPKGQSAPSGTYPIGWSIYADGRVFYYGPQAYQSVFDPTTPTWSRYYLSHLEGFGDMIPYRPGGDAFSTVLSGHNQTTGAQSYIDSGVFTHGNTTYPCMCVPRQADGVGTSQIVVSIPFGGRSDNGLSGQVQSQYGPFPNPIDGTLIYAPRYIRPYTLAREEDFAPRCEVPGLLSIPQSRVFQALGRGAILDGEGRWSGRKLYGHVIGNPSNDPMTSPESVGVTLVDLTGPWR